MTKNWRGQLLARTVLAGVSALAAPSLIVGSMLLAPAAVAQDYTSGNLTGTVVDAAGAPVSGATVVVKSQGQGFERTVTTNALGEFRVPLVPQGLYTATVSKAGIQSTSATDLRVQIGAANSYRIEVAAETSREVVVVTGVKPQEEFSQTTTGVTVDVEDFNARMPIARNITALTLLAPGAVPADQAFSIAAGAQLLGPASISGASGGENAFFVNGLNTTNFVNGIGGATVPFYFYQNVDVKTGGYNAEYGRATGGVVNAVTKAGSNQFEFAAHLDWEPEDLRAEGKNSQASGTNVIGQHGSLNDRDEQSVAVEVSGPIIKDRLFFYALGQWQKIETKSGGASGTYTESKIGDPFYGFKLDGFITDDHHLEFTYFDTSSKRKRDIFSFNPATDVINRPAGSSDTLLMGGESYVARYTGQLTDALTVSAAYGRSEADQATLTNLSSVPRVQDARGTTTIDVSPQRTAAQTFPFLAEREFYRADVDYYLDFFGQHHFRAGYDQENTTLNEQSVRNGGANYTYSTAGATNSLGLATGQQYIQRRVFTSGGGYDGTNKAYYLQDSWDVTDRLNLQLGYRRDSFSINDPNGTTFLDLADNDAVRLGASYDVFGDKSSKLYGFYGRYFLPAASNTAFRAASPAVDLTEFFLPAGGGRTIGALNAANGLPAAGLGPQITAATGAGGLAACPANSGSLAASGTVACSVRNNGASPVVQDIRSNDLKATYEDEYIVGYSTQLNSDWSAGVSLTYRDLGRVSEDVLIDQGILAYCARKGIAGCGNLYGGQDAYLIINPGDSANITLGTKAPNGSILHPVLPNGESNITLTAEDLGFPKPRREYIGLTFDFNREFDGKWGLRGSYTISKSEGNFEGALKSDTGQTDAGIVSDFDFLAFLPGQYGLLPNHHAHQFKLNGTYAPIENLILGMNASVISPRHYGCIGLADPDYLDGTVANNSYNVENARFCQDGAGNSVIVDRGSRFTADWVTRLDLSVRYMLPENIMPVGQLTLRADVFNVLNLKGATEAYEFGDLDGGGRDPSYGLDTNFQTPRYFRFGIDYNF